MRSSLRLLFFYSLAMVALAPASFAKIKYDEKLLVYTSDVKGFSEQDLEPLFDRLLRENRPLVVFVHGRGKEPSKSLQGAGFFAQLAGVDGKAVSKLEAYGPRVLMVSWDSERGSGLTDRQRALGNTPNGGKRLGIVLNALEKSLARFDGTRPSLTLLAQSMGTIVIQRYVESDGSRWRAANASRLFTNVVLSSADADDIGHPRWVDSIAGVERVFITVNPKDPVLAKSNEARQANAIALGRNPGNALSTTAFYVDIDIKAHEVFTKRPEHPELSRFFSAVFAGNDVITAVHRFRPN